MAGSEGEQGQVANEASSSSQGVVSEAEDGHVEWAVEDKPTHAALEPALELTPQVKGKPIEELSAEEANDMTCAICLDQIPVPELCGIKGCDHVYCGVWLPSFCCSLLMNRLKVCGQLRVSWLIPVLADNAERAPALLSALGGFRGALRK